MDAFTLFAPAKINLSLKVVGRRKDGFHLLDSIVAFVNLGDTLSFEPASSLELVIDGPMAAPLLKETDNMVLRAGRRLADFYGVNPNAKIRLTKNLPVASGIGGGSTDGAAALIGLSRLWNVGLSFGEWNAFGLALGADVPVCLGRVPARMQGVGEIRTTLPAFPQASIVLANPGTPLSTPLVYRTRKGDFSEPNQPIPEEGWKDLGALVRYLEQNGNDLTEAALSLAPEIGVVLDQLANCPGSLLARMSGSGATCFGLFEDDALAGAAAQKLKEAYPSWWVEKTTFYSPDQS